MAAFKEINGLGASDLAADLAKIMVDDYCRSDNPKARAQQQDDMEFTLEPLLEDNKEFHSAILRTAWWILNNRFEGKRAYILDSEGGIDFYDDECSCKEWWLRVSGDKDSMNENKQEMES